MIKRILLLAWLLLPAFPASAAPVDELIKGSDITVKTGDAAEAARVLNLFDRYDPARAVVIPARNMVQDHM